MLDQMCVVAGANSTVWNFFGLRRDTNGKAVDDGTAFCMSCNKAVIAGSGNISNLRSHLENDKLLYSQMAGSGSQDANPNPKQQQQPLLKTFMKSEQLQYCTKVSNGKTSTILWHGFCVKIVYHCGKRGP